MKTLKDGLYGLIVGDALGVPVEFRQRGSYKITDMIGFGTYNQPEGTFSDDSSMTLATCHSIKEKGGINLEDIMEKFCLWYYEGKYTPFGKCFDIGNTTSQAIITYKKTRSLEAASQKDERDNGNGSLMRVLPLIFIDASDEDVEKVSALTHGHEISKEACVIYVNIGKRILSGEKLEDILQDVSLSKNYERLRYLCSLNEEDIKSTGYVLTSLEAALWCILKTSSYKDCVLKAVNLGNDTDTIGAIAGGLAGLIYGYDQIPISWIEKIKNKKLIDNCLF